MLKKKFGLFAAVTLAGSVFLAGCGDDAATETEGEGGGGASDPEFLSILTGGTTGLHLLMERRRLRLFKRIQPSTQLKDRTCSKGKRLIPFPLSVRFTRKPSNWSQLQIQELLLLMTWLGRKSL